MNDNINRSGTGDLYLIYLRKSRKDLEAEEGGAGETLARHRKILFDLAKSQNYNVVRVFEEVVSGDSISARPEMQNLLREVETGLYAGVLVVEVERLSRGDGIDQAIVSRTFQYTNTKIITPTKIYDPSNEMDEEFFEFGLFMSRREYKTIKRRLKRGKEIAAQEGKWSNGSAPYGYQTVKVPGQKGLTLAPSDDADTVRLIFSLYVGGAGIYTIAARLNSMNIPTPGKRSDWKHYSVSDILHNPVYAGYIRTNAHTVTRQIVNGDIITRRVKSAPDAVNITKGIHEPLITEDTWRKAQDILSYQNAKLPKTHEMQNPFASLLRCSACGYVMSGTQYNYNHGGFLYCGHCKANIGALIPEVETAVVQSLEHWVSDLTVDAAQYADEAPSTAAYEKIIEQRQADIDKLQAQKQKAYELVEQGVYTIELFQERMKQLHEQERIALTAQEEARLQIDHLHAVETAKKEMLPKAQSVLAAYRSASTPAEKNSLLRSILSRIDYKKTRSSRCKSGSDLTLILHPYFSK